MTKRIIALALALLMLATACLFTVTAADNSSVYPELMITEIGVDQYGDASNSKNINKDYTGTAGDKDPYEFIEVVNNSNQTVNVYDYMLARQGAAPTNTAHFEKTVDKYTPIYPGADWTDGNYTSYDAYWANDAYTRPVNPEYKDGTVAAGEVFVIWVYSADSHNIHATFEQFRKFWSVDSSVKVFIIDGNGTSNKRNFSLNNYNTSTYSIVHESERFVKRRSTDTTYSLESLYPNFTYESFDEIISWANVDYTTSPLNGKTDKEQSNYTISYVPYSAGVAEQNGYSAACVASNKRAHLEKVNTYAEASVGKLTASQKTAFTGKQTSVIRCKAQPQVVIDEVAGRPSLLITEISCDNYTKVSQNTNTETTANADPYEFIEVYNNSDKAINIYDYMVGYQGSSPKNVSTYFERLVQEYTPIFPGADWIDGPYNAYDSYWANTTVQRPVNPAYEEGVLQPGEVAVLWAYSSDSHSCHATMEQFRTFWSIPTNVKTFIFDANSERDRNFNIKNSETGTYILLQPCDKYPVRRGDESSSTFNTEGGKYLDRYYNLQENWSYDTAPEIVSWAVICFNVYEPLYTFRKNNGSGTSNSNFTLEYAPYNGEKVYGNGFLTVSIPSQKRMHLIAATKTASAGVITAEQQAKIAAALK